MTSAPVTDLLPGYFLDPENDSGAWMTLPWPGDRSLKFGDPLRTSLLPPSLGPGVMEWCERWLVHHLTGDPWWFTRGQARFLHLWYALRDDGRWLYRSGVKRGAKGTGKDPLGAALALAELAGPVRFVGWESDGTPRAESHRLALVQIAANSEAQGADMLRVANAMASQAFREEFGYDAGILRSLISNGSRIELLTNSERSSEGDPATAILLNESHHMTYSSGGQKLAGVARRNVGKSPGGQARMLELTNAHMPGEASVAEESFEAWQAQVSGRTRRQDILYDSVEAAPHLKLHIESELETGIAQAYQDSSWTDKERIRDEAQDPRVPPADSIRFYFNALPTNEQAWADPRKFDAGARPDLIVADGEQIAMFLDCSKSTDATTFVGCRLSDGHVMALGGWQRPHGDRGKGWLAPREIVDAAVRAAKDRWSVAWFGVDPSPARDDSDESLYWGELIDQWHRDFRDDLPLWATPGSSAVLFDMRTSTKGGTERNRAFTEAAMATVAAIEDEESLTHDGDSMLRMHVHNARRRDNPWGVSLGKRTRSDSHLVDYAVSMVGARLGRRLVLNSGALNRATKESGGKRPGAVYGF
jgi:hypothetical protein